MSAILPLGRISPVVRLAAFMCLLVSFPAVSIAAGFAPSVLSSDPEELEFSVELSAPSWRRGVAADPAQEVWNARLPGFTFVGTPGQTRVLRTGGWLVVPPGTTPRLEVVREDWQPLDGRRLAIEPIPVMRGDQETGGYFEESVVPRPGEVLPEDRIPDSILADMRGPSLAVSSGPAVQLGTVAWWRGRRIVNYVLSPMRARADGRATAFLHGGQWRIRFVDDPTAGRTPPAGAARRLTGKGDDRFAGFLLNGELLMGLSTEAAHRGVAPAKAARPRDKGTPLGYPDVRLPVLATQLHRVRASELIDRDLIPGGGAVADDQIRLYQRRYVAELDDPTNDHTRPYIEVEVPIHMVGDGGVFDGDDLFLFWGLRLRDDGEFDYTVGETLYELDDAGDRFEINNEANIYWLQLAEPDAETDWARMESTSLDVSTGSPLTTYRRTDYLNEAVDYRENVPAIDIDRYYYNNYQDNEVRVGLDFWAPVEGQTGAVIRAGISNWATAGRTLLVDLMQGDDLLASLPDFFTDTRYERIFSTLLPPTALTAADLDFRLRNSFAGFRLYSYLDWVELSYDAHYAAPFGRLLFPGSDVPGTSNLEIPGFTSNDVGLIEVTDPRNPRFVVLAGNNLVDNGDGYTLSLHVPQPSGIRRFYTATRMTSNGVADVRYQDARLSDDIVPTALAESSADVLVVTHPEFRERTEQWVEYRRTRAGASGLTFQIVEPQDLYDWYTGGLKNPWAIKRLVNHALASSTWGSWSLVLVGDANENPRELEVPTAGRIWSKDWVPTHFHVQTASGLAPEILASDEWFANPDAADGSGFPGTTLEPADLYVGRFPVNSNSDFDRIFTKVRQAENSQPGETWRRRAIFTADDAWSSANLGIGGAVLAYKSWERDFEISERYMASLWANNLGMVSLEADSVWLSTFMDLLHPDLNETVLISEAREWCETSGAVARLITALSAGGLIAHYQGHANHWLMAHEVWFQHDMRSDSIYNRRDVDELTNVGKPWLFCGMGCHLADFIQNVGHPAAMVEPGMGEKMLVMTDAGAYAVYASSGYEYLSPNRNLSERFLERLTMAPPSTTVRGQSVTSRWMLGEVMWAAESDLLAAANVSTNRNMVYQYTVLGDPLMYLDCGAPEVDAELVGAGGGPIEGEVDLLAVDAGGTRLISLQARDEAGIDRLRVVDSTSADLTGQVVTDEQVFYDNGSRQIIDYELTVPVRPFDHQVLVHVHDSADQLDGDDHAVITLNVEQVESVFTAEDGEPLDAATFVFTVGDPVELSMTVQSAAWFDDDTEVTLDGDNIQVSDFLYTVESNHLLQVEYTATAMDEKVARSVELSINGYVSIVELEAGAAEAPSAAISGLVNFPNPMREETRFVFATNLRSGNGTVRVWTVSGRSVVEVPFILAGDGQEMVGWNGRDREGDHLANGTYLYRVEVDNAGGQVRSDMQRLVIMR